MKGNVDFGVVFKENILFENKKLQWEYVNYGYIQESKGRQKIFKEKMSRIM